MHGSEDGNVGAVNRFAGYVTAVSAGSFVYTCGGLAFFRAVLFRSFGLSGLNFLHFAMALFFCVFCTAFAGMFVPWWLTVLVSCQFKRIGGFYFIGNAALASLAIGCILATLILKGAFNWQVSLFEGIRGLAVIQGWLLLLAGIVGGLCYWFVSERGRTPDIP